MVGIKVVLGFCYSHLPLNGLCWGFMMRERGRKFLRKRVNECVMNEGESVG